MKTDIKSITKYAFAAISKVYHESLAVMVLIVFAIIFFLRLYYPVSSVFMLPDFGESDVLHLNLPLKYFLATSLKNNQWPFWNEKLSGGFPVLAESQIGTFYLPNLILFKYLPITAAYNLNLFLAFFLTGLGTYLLCRKLGFNRLPSLYTGLVFSYSGYFSVHLNHFNLLQSASLLPFIFFAAFKFLRKTTVPNLLFISLLLCEQIFAGYFYVTFITLLGMLLIFIFNNLKKIHLFFLSVIPALLLASIQILPTLELTFLSQRNGGFSFATVTDMSYPLRHLLTFLAPYFYGDPAKGTYPVFSANWGIFWENTAYLGLIPLLLSFSSLILLGKKQVRLFLWLSGISLLLLLGKQSPLYFLFSLPPFNLFRNTSRYILLLAFSLTVLSGMAADSFTKKINSGFAQKIFYILLFAALLFDEFQFSFKYPPVSPVNLWLSPPANAEFIGKNSFRIKSYGQEIAWNDIFLKSGWKNLDDYLKFRDYLYPDYNLFFNIKSIGVNTGGLIPRRTQFWSTLTDNVVFDRKDQSLTLSDPAKNTLSLWGVDTIISSFALKDSAWLPENKLNKTSASQIMIYQNSNVRPEKYFAANIIKVASVEDLYRKIGKLKDRDVLIENPFDLKNHKLLVFNRSWYPGWHLYLDGRETKVQTVNLNQPAILVDNLDHKFEFKYASGIFNTGKTISVASAFIVFLAVFLSVLRFPRKV